MYPGQKLGVHDHKPHDKCPINCPANPEYRDIYYPPINTYTDAPDNDQYLTAPYRHPLFATCKNCWALVDRSFMELHAERCLGRRE